MTLPEWLTESNAPWWAVIGTPLLVALLTYWLTRWSARQEQERAQRAGERKEMRDRKVLVYADFADALNRQHLGILNENQAQMLAANLDMLRALALIRLLSPGTVLEVADVASDAMSDRPGDHHHWHQTTLDLLAVARADIEGGSIHQSGT